jgi:hypothetical protein
MLRRLIPLIAILPAREFTELVGRDEGVYVVNPKAIFVGQ